jgi:hypothetical protein
MIVSDEEDDDADDEDADLCSFCSALFHFAGTRFFGLHKPFQGNLPPFVPLFHIYKDLRGAKHTLQCIQASFFSFGEPAEAQKQLRCGIR